MLEVPSPQLRVPLAAGGGCGKTPSTNLRVSDLGCSGQVIGAKLSLDYAPKGTISRSCYAWHPRERKDFTRFELALGSLNEAVTAVRIVELFAVNAQC